MCDAVFRDLRTKERARTWTLDAMARFWIAVVLRAPDSLREALEEAHGGRAGFPFVESTTSSFFERAQGMRWEFFDELFRRFLASVLPETRPGCSPCSPGRDDEALDPTGVRIADPDFARGGR